MSVVPNIRFDGQAAIVTGGGRGLGRAFAMDLARRGARVIVNGRPPAAGGGGAVDSVVEEIRRAGGEAAPCYAGVETPEGGAAIVDAALQHFGRIDILINNAGFLRNGAFEELAEPDIDAVLAVHLRAVFHLSQPAFRVMRRQGYGRIVNITSTTALIALPGLANYAAAKGGVSALTRAMAAEGAGDRVFTNAVAPSAIGKMQAQSAIPGFKEAFAGLREKLWPRMQPETVAPLVTYLASAASQENGAAFVACAGRFARVGLMFAKGWIAPDANAASAEDIAANYARIADMSDGFEPRTLADIYQDIIERLPRS
ncbi:MAG: SDR family NAD(P)-dependent oxidoreductase [Hyphomonadaceae bacterium]|nr:SDR family NAD(P)-dependent oxidoreductase [Hyphomonadaceae bacterium]